MANPPDPTPQTPQAILQAAILQFQIDAGLVHEFAKGDATVTVVGADGDYPSLAKLAADAQAYLDSAIQAQVAIIAQAAQDGGDASRAHPAACGE